MVAELGLQQLVTNTRVIRRRDQFFNRSLIASRSIELDVAQPMLKNDIGDPYLEAFRLMTLRGNAGGQVAKFGITSF